MPWPPVYTGGQDDDRTRAIDFVHIEPSIREGVHLIPSLYGSDASAPLYRYPPTNTVQPWISGNPKIPNILTCNEGQWPASPSAKFAYQWMSDGIDLAGETARTYTTTASVDSTLITCEVRGYNYLGQAYALTDPLAVSLIEPQEVREQEDIVITGLQAVRNQTIHDKTDMVVTGLQAINAQTVVRNVAYFMTGMAAENRHDIEAAVFNVISGRAADNRMDMLNEEGVAVINWDTGKPFYVEPVQPLHIKNPDAEAGTAGWDIFGAATFRKPLSDNYEGEYSWWGGENVDAAQANIPYSYMWTDVEIWPVWESEVDLGNTYIYLSWYQSNSVWKDQGNVRVHFLDVNKTFISSNGGPGLLATHEDVWTRRKLQAVVPPNTRYIRIFMEFNLQYGDDNNAYIDFITGEIHTGVYPSSRDYGPDFQEWRIKFLQANTYSGCGLSELEFRNSVGGLDLATGGTPLAGSEGIGGLATYAFDDLRNTGYWAGGENGVAFGTAWLGYSFNSVIRPVEIDITARTGTNALQVGREFMLEGKAPGSDLWTPVQYFSYDQVGDFTSGQQKQFVVAEGVLPYTHEQAQIDYGNTTKTYTSTIYQNVGSIFEAKTRMNITHLRAFVEEAATYRLGICKITFQEAQGIMYQYTPLDFEVEVIAGVGGFIEGALPQTFFVEVGDAFVVYIMDPTDPGAGNRVAAYSYPTPNIPNYYATRLRTWGNDLATLVEGAPNNNGASAFYEVDFRGTIF